MPLRFLFQITSLNDLFCFPEWLFFPDVKPAAAVRVEWERIRQAAVGMLTRGVSALTEKAEAD